ncbi:hypothetical protein [Hydrococcus rivularis]|uniref:pirin family protein n=1 Tax=Hydrococcus rivularis TaxID=1616834 RepID=UPI001C311EAE|nr:hypothetical protein [Hydrococcus rivularis]
MCLIKNSIQGKYYRKYVVSPDGREGSATIHQDICLYASILEPGSAIAYQIQPGRYGWLQIAQGIATLNGERFGQATGCKSTVREILKLAPM